MPRRPEPSLHAADWATGLVVGDCHEIAQGLFADFGPALDDLFGRRPLLVADLTGTEDVAAAPASLYVFDALEELGVPAALGVDAAHLPGIGGDVSAAAPLRVAQQDKEPPGEVDEDLVACRGFRQDRHVAVLRDGTH